MYIVHVVEVKMSIMTLGLREKSFTSDSGDKGIWKRLWLTKWPLFGFILDKESWTEANFIGLNYEVDFIDVLSV